MPGLFDLLGSVSGAVSTGAKAVNTIFGTSNRERYDAQIKQGVAFQQQGLRQAANSTIAAANFNNEIDRINTERRLDALGRQTARLVSSTRASMAASGLASTSGSALAVMNEQISQAERQIMQESVDLLNRQNANLFEAQSRATGLESQARATGFRGEQEAARRNLAKPSLGSRLSSALGSVEQVGGALKDIGDLF